MLVAFIGTLLVSDWAMGADASGSRGPVFGFIEENDLVADTDRHYTQGLKLYYWHGEGQHLGWTGRFMDAFPTLGLKAEESRWGLTIGQNIYTPGDISVPGLLINDRPYAGWLYGGLLLQRRGRTGGDWLAWDNLELDLGIIGPESLAGDAQNWVHQIRGFQQALGWANQLKTEPAIELKLSRHWLRRWHVGEGWSFDAIPHTGLALGNVVTAGHLGGAVRFGYRVPENYGYQTIDSLAVPAGGIGGDWWDGSDQGFEAESWRDWGIFAFAGADGRAVAYSAFLDGNLFHNSHHVKRRPLVADLKCGMTFWWKRLEATYALVLRTEEFHGQSARNAFGSFSLSWKF
jgi:lipid A 3-O-deacylase